MLNQNKRWTKSPFLTVLWAVGISAIGSSARAGFIDFNPTGSNASPVTTISGIDLGPGNALARNSLPLTVGSTFQLYYQASVANLLGTDGMPLPGMGLNTSFQITAVASFTEVVRSIDPAGSATFALAPTQAADSFFQLYYNPAVISNNLAGTGFNLGTLILSGKPSVTSPNVGIFSLSAATGIPGSLDQFNSTNQYPNLSTVEGSGSSLVSSDVTFSDPNFFKTAFSQITFNSSLITAFKQTSPSGLFLGQAGGGVPGIFPDLGSVNGSGVTGKDFQFQADANFSFINFAVPEPASIIQVSLGMFAIFCGAGWVGVRGHHRTLTPRA